MFVIGNNYYHQRIAKSKDGNIFIREIPYIRGTRTWELEMCINGEYLYQRGSCREIMKLFDDLVKC